MNLKRIQACLLILLTLVLFSACADTSAKLITDAGTLLDAIEKAESGATLLVGDIDFSPSPGVSNEFTRMSLKKSIHIQSGLKGRNAVFTNAGFQLAGSKAPGETLECRFSGITFDGGVSAQSLVVSDWEVPVDADGMPLLREPMKSQYAFSFGGNVDARFEGCVFQNYMYDSGPVMHAYYGDYTGNPELNGLLGDYSGCKLSISLSGCELTGNAALYGGAIYLDGNDNVRFYADGCKFIENVSGCGEFSEGGGACRFSAIEAVLTDCSFVGNEGNHCYLADRDDRIAAYQALAAESDEIDRTDYTYLADTDRTQGGAIFAQRGSLLLANCEFRNNRASLGGAVLLQNTAAQMEHCAFTGNVASPSAVNPYRESGPWASMGMGGALYVNTEPGAPVAVFSSDFIGNTAQYAYGSIYGFWTNEYPNLMPHGLGSIDLYGCTIRDNVCETTYDYLSSGIYPWASHPGDILDIEYLNLHGCVFQDESYRADFPRHELPTVENNYCYVSAPGDAAYQSAADIKVPENIRSRWNAARRPLPATAPEHEKPGIPNGAWIAVCVVLVAAIAAILLFRKRSSTANADADIGQEAIPAPKDNTPSGKAVVSEAELASLKENVLLRQLLTEREMDVMCEYIAGSSRSRLAEKLVISEATAKTHISNIYAKLEVRSKAELVQKLKNL